MGFEAAVVLFVGFCCVVVWVEATDAVVVVSTGFSEFFGEGEAEVTPVVVAGGDVKAPGFDALGYDFDVVGCPIGVGHDGCVAVCWLVQPFFWVEFIFCHVIRIEGLYMPVDRGGGSRLGICLCMLCLSGVHRFV